MSPLPSTKSDSHSNALQRRGNGGRMNGGEGGGAEEKGDDRSRWGRKRGWRERVNSHVTGPSCSVDGKKEIQQPQKKG